MLRLLRGPAVPAAVVIALLLAAGAQGRVAQTVTLELWVAPEGQVTVSEPSLDGISVCESGQGSVCTLRYEAPKRLVLTAAPLAPYAFHGWTAVECAGVTNPCVLDLRADEPVVSVFALFNPARLQVRVSAPEGDTTSRVTGPGGIDCSQQVEVTCESQPLATGEPRVLTAHTTLSVEWLFGCEPVAGNPNQCVARSENQIVGVKIGGAPGPDRPFDVEVTLRVAKVGGGNGSVTGSGFDCGAGDGCRQRLKFGEPVTFVAREADAGSRFDRWLGVCGTDPTCRFNAGPVTSVQARFLPAQPPPPPPPPQPPPPPPPPPPTKLAVRVTSLSAARVGGRWRVNARVVVNERATVRGRVGRAKRTWSDRTAALRPGATTLSLRLSPRATKGACWFILVARDGQGEVRTLRRTVRLGR